MIEEQCTGCWVIPNHKDIWHVAHCPFYENSMTQKMANCQLDFFEMRDKVTTQEKQIESLKAETAVMKSILSDIFYGHILTGQTDFEDELEERIKKILEVKI